MKRLVVLLCFLCPSSIQESKAPLPGCMYKFARGPCTNAGAENVNLRFMLRLPMLSQPCNGQQVISTNQLSNDFGSRRHALSKDIDASVSDAES